MPVTGLGWREHGKETVLFIVTTGSIQLYHVATNRDELLDQHGCELGCAVMTEDGNLIVGRQEVTLSFTKDCKMCNRFIDFIWFSG